MTGRNTSCRAAPEGGQRVRWVDGARGVGVMLGGEVVDARDSCETRICGDDGAESALLHDSQVDEIAWAESGVRIGQPPCPSYVAVTDGQDTAGHDPTEVVKHLNAPGTGSDVDVAVQDLLEDLGIGDSIEPPTGDVQQDPLAGLTQWVWGASCVHGDVGVDEDRSTDHWLRAFSISCFMAGQSETGASRENNAWAARMRSSVLSCTRLSMAWRARRDTGTPCSAASLRSSRRVSSGRRISRRYRELHHRPVGSRDAREQCRGHRHPERCGVHRSREA